MAQFHLYAKYYDLLYKDKDYHGEAAYVSELIRQYSPYAKSILNLGCGTGKHDIEFAEMGYTVTGIDLSDDMISNAKKNAATTGNKLHFEQGDIRQLNLGEKFDAVISLFHVMSYQTSNEDILSTFRTVQSHLKEGGIFIFDCWYGPGVLSDPPVVRIKRLESKDLKIIRLAEPVMHPNENVVDVNYTIIFKDDRPERKAIQECHRMRYLFVPEVKNLLEQMNFQFISVFDWMKREQPSFGSWSACFICKKDLS
jgi:SAM-dependent methyltransferase